jgi:hypothetical protein
MWKFSVVPSLFAGLALSLLPTVSSAGVFLSINIAPPALQVYQQPLCPTDGFLWTPGYWGYGNAGYYWIPGAWVAPPQSGFLWTPGYWGFSNGLYAFNAGYWGPTVGFYGGVNYGFGYGGSGFNGGRWDGGRFSYNTAVSRVNTTVIHNTYTQNVTNNNNHTSFNGGPGGISARPSAAETVTARAHGQGASAPAAQQRASTGGPTQARQATEAARPEAANNRSAEPQGRPAAHTTTPSAARPEERQAASAPRAAPQQAQRAAPQQEPKQVASNRSTAPSRPAPEQRPQATRAAAPQQHAAAPQQYAAAPQQHAAPAKPAEGREEKK